MPQIGWFEILVIVVLAILIIGPKDFPVVIKKIGNWTGSVKRYFSEIQKDVTEIWSFTPKNFEITIKSHDSSDSTCSGRLLYLHELQGSAKQNSASAFVYPTISFIDDETGDNLSVYEIKINISSNKRTLLDDGMINSYNSNKTCGYNANDWADNVSMDVGGCNEITPSIDVGLDHSMIIYSSVNNSSIRIGHSDSDNNSFDFVLASHVIKHFFLS
mgnify:CR=1 FL=1